MHSQRPPAFIAALVLSVVVLAGLAGAARSDVDPSWDHYKAYQATPQVSFALPVNLSDQFGVSSHLTQTLDFFANPVEKRHGTLISPIHRGDLHYTWWHLEPEAPIAQDLIAINQFGTQTLHLNRAVYLLNPALKNEASDIPIPVANHYKCYACSGSPVNVQVVLVDQFFARPASVFSPRFFCTPVRKQIDGGADYPILEPDQHYVVYDIDPTTPFWPAFVRDQFLAAQVNLNLDGLLAVPTEKMIPTPAVSSTWGRVKSSYR